MIAKVMGEVAHSAVESGLANTHHVVASDDFFAAVVSERND